LETAAYSARRSIFYLQHQDKSQQAFDAEIAAFDTSAMQVRTAGTFGDRRLLVLTAGEAFPPDPLVPGNVTERKKQVWMELHAAQARLSSHGRQIVVGNSSHVIPYDRPDAVIGAIREVWDNLRRP